MPGRADARNKEASPLAVEELQYAILVKEGNFEIRQYAPHIVAETVVKGGFGWVGNVAFRRLAGYIFGKNRRRDAIAMTAPVLQEPARQTIAMTAPVLQEAAGNAWAITFVMPAQYTMATLPEPLDANVTLHERPAGVMAALMYSGTWSRRRFAQKQRALETRLAAHGYQAAGAPIFARYNPPMTLWFRRRNEVLIPVEPARDS